MDAKENDFNYKLTDLQCRTVYENLSSLELVIKSYLTGDIKQEALQSLLKVRMDYRSFVSVIAQARVSLTEISEIALSGQGDSPTGMQYRLKTIAEVAEKALKVSEDKAKEFKSIPAPECFIKCDSCHYPANATGVTCSLCVEANNELMDAAIKTEFNENKKRIAELEKQVKNLRASLGMTKSELNDKSRALEDERLKYEDLELIYKKSISSFWEMIYPGDTNGWAYPGQVIRHTKAILGEKDALIDRLTREIEETENLNLKAPFTPESEKDNKTSPLLGHIAEDSNVPPGFLVGIGNNIVIVKYSPEKDSSLSPEQEKLKILREQSLRESNIDGKLKKVLSKS